MSGRCWGIWLKEKAHIQVSPWFSGGSFQTINWSSLFFNSTLFIDNRPLYRHGCQNDENNGWRWSPHGNRQEAAWVSPEPWVLLTHPGVASPGIFPLESLFYPVQDLQELWAGNPDLTQVSISGLQESSQHLPLPCPAGFSISHSDVALLTSVNPNSEAVVIISWPCNCYLWRILHPSVTMNVVNEPMNADSVINRTIFYYCVVITCILKHWFLKTHVILKKEKIMPQWWVRFYSQCYKLVI